MHYYNQGDILAFESGLQAYLQTALSYLDVGGRASIQEQIYHVLMMGLVAHCEPNYLIKSNREIRGGRYDLVLIPRDKHKVGVIMEFKRVDLSSPSQPSLELIQERLEQTGKRCFTTNYR